MTSAIILVGGQGTRLRPLTDTTPKPLLDLGGVPLLEHQFARLVAAGIREVVLATCYRAEQFQDSFGDGTRLGLDIAYVHEEVPLGTGGAIGNAASALPADGGDVVVLNGDILSGHSIAAQVDHHQATGASVTLHLVRVDDPRRYGTVVTDPAGRVTAFLEKTEHPPVSTINAGCYVFRRDVARAIPRSRPVSVEREIFPALVTATGVAAYLESAYWIDIGTLESYAQAQSDIRDGRYLSPALV